MSFGQLSKPLLKALAPYIEGERVLDLGAHDLSKALKLLENGAQHVVAVDRTFPAGTPKHPNITTIETQFHNLKERERVAFVSWPINHHVSLAPVLADAEIVIYVGKNTSGTVCGATDFWEHLTGCRTEANRLPRIRTGLGREILAYVPKPRNVLIVYGPKRVERELRGEEFAAIYLDKMWSYKEVEDDLAACWATLKMLRTHNEGWQRIHEELMADVTRWKEHEATSNKT